MDYHGIITLEPGKRTCLSFAADRERKVTVVAG